MHTKTRPPAAPQVELGKPIMFVGGAGVGKTQLVKGKLAALPEDALSLAISFNYFTDVASFQKARAVLRRSHTSCSSLRSWRIHSHGAGCPLLAACQGVHSESAPTPNPQALEGPLEKKAGINYGPPGTKRLVYFIDDLNMPRLDAYETAMPISLIRQHLGWGHWRARASVCMEAALCLDAWALGSGLCREQGSGSPTLRRPRARPRPRRFDRAKLTQKNVHNTQYVAAMNPTAGSFVVNPRLQRLFMTLAVTFPGQDRQAVQCTRPPRGKWPLWLPAARAVHAWARALSCLFV